MEDDEFARLLDESHRGRSFLDASRFDITSMDARTGPSYESTRLALDVGDRVRDARVDRWIRDWRRDGLAGLTPSKRADTGTVRAHPELADVVAALRIELPGRSAAQIADIVWHRHSVRISERTIRSWIRGRGLHREALVAEPKAFGRFEAEATNSRWITDVLVGPFVPYPQIASSVRARLFLIVEVPLILRQLTSKRSVVVAPIVFHADRRAAQALPRSQR